MPECCFEGDFGVITILRCGNRLGVLQSNMAINNAGLCITTPATPKGQTITIGENIYYI